MEAELKWQITSSKKRKQIQEGVLIIGPVLIGFIFLFLTSRFNIYNISFKEIIYAILGVIISFLLLLLINKIFPYQDRKYSLDNNGITISKGKKTKRYLWTDFECFHPYSEGRGFKPDVRPRSLDLEESREKIFEAGKKIEGYIFYLKKKQKNIFSKLYKVFVVVYSEIENQKAVNKFLSNHLPKKSMKNTTDLGLIFYEFK